MSRPWLGIIADDFTGATDVAGFLVANGQQTVQLNGVPVSSEAIEADALVISLKSRSCPVNKAVEDSLAALSFLQLQGCQQFYFKYCSTFDSTAQGNIGAVTDALLAALGENFTVLCPALPVNGRTVVNGHLFVHGELLSDTDMRHHPVTPMSDSSLLRLMNAQAKGNTGLVDYTVLAQGAVAVRDHLEVLQQQGLRYGVLDTPYHKDLEVLAEAVADYPLLTGGSGLAAGLAKNRHKTTAQAAQHPWPKRGKTIILSGSCSAETRKQLAHYSEQAEAKQLDVAACLSDRDYYLGLADWVESVWHASPQGLAPMVFATVAPEQLQAIQAQHGASEASLAVEACFAALAKELQQRGAVNFIVAGGETSGIVSQSLGVEGFVIGEQIAPGVPWVQSLDSRLSLALKSGHFGGEDFFSHAQTFFQ